MGLMMNSKQTPPPSSSRSFSAVQHLISSRWFAARNIIWIANLALVALLGYFIWGIATHRDEGKPPAVVEAPNPPKGLLSKGAEPASTEHGAAGSRSLFAPAAMSIASSGASSDEPATQLQLKLLGTIPGDKSIALADIQDIQSKMENLYHIGDTIQGALIAEIARGRVILLANGRREVLEMAVNSSAEPATAESPKPATTASAPSIHEVVKVISPTELQINKQKFLARVGGMQAVLKTVKLEPYVVDGKTQGMKISGLSDDVAAMASLANLQNGDVIQNINGQDLTSPQKTFQVLQKAQSQSALDVQVLRGDAVIPLHFSMSGSN